MKKSLLASAIGIALAALAAFAPQFGATTQQWLGLVTFTLTFVATTFFPSGVFVGDVWKAAYYVFLIGGFIMQLLGLIADITPIPAQWINYITLGVAFIVNQFGRTYPRPA